MTQSQRFDPQGAFIRRYVPELAGVPQRFIHEPWKLDRAGQEACGCIVGRDYPLPLVDHARQRARALALYEGVTRRRPGRTS